MNKNLKNLLTNPKIIFLLVGGTAAFVHQLIVIILVQLNILLPLQANIVAFLCAWLVSYFGHYYASFRSTESHFKAMPKFMLVAIMSFLVNQCLYYILLNYTSLHYALSLFIVLLIVAIFTYILGRIWAFKAS